MRIAFLGFGLISGSIARALRAAAEPRWRDARLGAWSPTGRGPFRAVREGVIDLAGADPASVVAEADLVIVGAPPLAALELLDQLGGPLRAALSSAAVVTDVTSTKTAVVARAERHGLRFVGGHPMAGREQAGYESAEAGLFADRPWVIVPGAGSAEADIRMVEALATACGSRPLRMSAADHDDAAAAISHLPLLVSAALVEAVAGGPATEPSGWATAAQLAAGGWRDMSRLARGDVSMGAGILATNAGPVADRLRALRLVLDDWQDELERAGGPDPRQIAERLELARSRVQPFGGSIQPPADPRAGSSAG
jgi:prephenate dehydrogenase